MYIVTGETRFFMDRTSLTVSGFNQPAVARFLLEIPGNAEKGLSQRFCGYFLNQYMVYLKQWSQVSRSLLIK